MVRPIMKCISLATLTAAAVLSIQPAKGDFKTNDLYLGFNASAAQSDYIIDLGQATTAVGVGGTAVKDLSGLVSLAMLTNGFTSGASGVNVAAVGGNNVFMQYAVYATQPRFGGPGNPAVPGSSLSGANHSSGTLAAAAGTLTGNPWPGAASSAVDSTKSYTARVGPTLASTDFYGKSGVNPFGTLDDSGVIYLDLWFANVVNGYSYKGYFTVDVSGSSPKLTFTPAAGTPPPPPPPAPTLSLNRVANVNAISFVSSNTATYKLYFTNAAGLTAPISNWPSLPGTIMGNGSTASFQDTTTDLERFYRVLAQ